MLGRLKITSIAVAAGLSLAATAALAQPGVDPTKDEVKCQSSTGKALSKYVSSVNKCVTKCIGGVRKLATNGPYSECFAPYSGVTLACINDPLKSADQKATASVAKACVDAPPKDKCPECYGAATCASGDPFISDSQAQLDIFGLLVYCREGIDGVDPTKEHAKCEDGTGKALVKFVGAVNKCYAKCNDNVFKLKIPDGSCDPGAVTDPTGATQACLQKGRDKAALSIDKVCADVGQNPPCYGSGVDTGAEWVSFTENVGINPIATDVACGSPSGAFLD